jgi:hypothetical protein
VLDRDDDVARLATVGVPWGAAVGELIGSARLLQSPRDMGPFARASLIAVLPIGPPTLTRAARGHLVLTCPGCIERRTWFPPSISRQAAKLNAE